MEDKTHGESLWDEEGKEEKREEREGGNLSGSKEGSQKKVLVSMGGER